MTVQAKDVDEAAVVEAIRACNEARCEYPMDAGYHGGRPGYGYSESEPPTDHWANRWDLGKLFPDVPEKVLLAKLRSMMKRRVISGCPCGCRGDLEVIAEKCPECGVPITIRGYHAWGSGCTYRPTNSEGTSE